MQSPELDWIHRMEATDERLRVSRALSEKSLQSLRRSQALVLQSIALLAQDPYVIPQPDPNPQILPANEVVPKEPHARAQVPSPGKSPRVGEGMEVVANRRIQSETVDMDGKHFVDCELLHCTLLYSGQPMILESTRFENCGFQFSGEAALTARFLECFQLLPEQTVDYVSSPSASGPMRPN